MINMCDIPPRGLKMASCMIANTTSVKHVIQRCFDDFNKMRARNAFMFWYENEGMGADEFQQADGNIVYVLGHYASYETGDKDQGEGEKE